MTNGPECDDCGFPLSLMGRDRSGPEYICFSCTARMFRELREESEARKRAKNEELRSENARSVDGV